MKLVLLPLDSRPCTCDFPCQLGALGGAEVRVPPMELLDHYRAPSRFEDLRNWLFEACRGADVLVCAAEQLVYGGLLSSRAIEVEEAEALSRLVSLRALRRACPGLSIYLSGVVMRTTVSTLREEDKVWWEKVARYAQASALADGDSVRAEEAKALRAEIPPAVLDTFLRARARNHAVNRLALELVGEGTAQEVCFLQEDSTPAGPHRAEQRALLAQAAELGVEDRVHLHCGTDEFACAMVGRLLAESGGSRPRLAVRWLAGEDRAFTARYEDRPFAENLSAYLRTCHIDVAADAAAVLLVYGPPSGLPQGDLCMEPERAVCAYPAKRLDGFCDQVEALLSSGRAVGLVDVYHANGGEDALLTRLAGRGLLSRLSAYAGWNTACNSLGTILGQLLALPYASPEDNRRFTRQRLLDDWVYQAAVRPRFAAALAARGEDGWNIADRSGADALLQSLMEAEPRSALACPAPFRAELRWPRTFEVAITIPTGGTQ